MSERTESSRAPEGEPRPATANGGNAAHKTESGQRGTAGRDVGTLAPSPDAATEPRTKAGRKAAKYDPYWLDTILAIEAEARRDAVTDAAQDWMRRAAEKKVAEAAAPAIEALGHTVRLLTELLPDTDNAALMLEQLTAERDHLREALRRVDSEAEAAMRRMVERAQASGTYDEYRPTATRTYAAETPEPEASDD